MSSTLTLPGLVDAHVHLREPGAPHKEDILSGTSAALAGGVIAVFDMPNNRPPIVDRSTFIQKKLLFEQKAVTDYGLFVGYDGAHVAQVVELASQAIGLKLYLDETFGDMITAEPRALAAIFEAWPGPGPIAIHAESHSIRVALGLARRYRQRLHVCHVPDPDDLVAIETARQGGADVTCELTPHHLFLTTQDAARLGPFGQMKPPLVSPEAVRMFWERLDLVDCIASDHAPHTRQEKESATPPPGVPGLETTLPLLLYAVHTGKLTLDRMVMLSCKNPWHIYRVPAPVGSFVEVEIDAPYRLPESGYITQCGWSPFAGCWALGRVRHVQSRGREVWRDGRRLAKPGVGRDLANCR